MSLLLFSFRKMQIIRQRDDINARIMELQRKQMDYQTYAASVADGSISLNDLTNCPPSLFGRMTQFMTYSHEAAMQGANQKFAYMSQLYAPQMQTMDQNTQQMFLFSMRQNLYEKERERFSRYEEKLLKQVDTNTEQEIARLSTQAKMLDSELQSIDQGEDNAIKSSTPKYA